MSMDENQALVLQLREANQNLVIAALGARDLQAKAESVNRRQEEFLAMLAHELRNPLAPIMTATELLGRITGAHPQLPKLHGIISRQADHMSHLVDDLVDASRVRSGKITLRKRPIKLSEIMESAVETSRPFIDKHHHRLIVDLSVDPVIDGDLVRLAQVFSNLLINAAKFTQERGRITVSTRIHGRGVAVSVKDDGIGIALDVQLYIFDLFTQGLSSLDRSQGGLGIGLSVVRSILEMHSGSVKVHSAGAGQGSEFIVSLPISDAAFSHDGSLPQSTNATSPCRILLIEDNVDLNQTLNDMLTLEGHAVTSAFDGISGLAMAKENSYDVVICDIGLPGIDGYEIVRQLRAVAPSGLPRFVALTGYNQPENRLHATKAGFDHYLVKPISADMVMNIISMTVLQ